MELTVDTFRALAHSSPWRWRTLHFTYADDHEAVEAWLRALLPSEKRRLFRSR
jgi:hypothetical protein